MQVQRVGTGLRVKGQWIVKLGRDFGNDNAPQLSGGTSKQYVYLVMELPSSLKVIKPLVQP